MTSRSATRDEAARHGSQSHGAVRKQSLLHLFLGRPSMTSPWMLQFGGHHPRLEYQDVGSHRGDDADTHVSDLECWDQARTTKRSRPKGMKASAMKAKQQAMLLDIIAERAGILNQSSAVARMARAKVPLGTDYRVRPI